jgi:hypothetical protein
MRDLSKHASVAALWYEGVSAALQPKLEDTHLTEVEKAELQAELELVKNKRVYFSGKRAEACRFLLERELEAENLVPERRMQCLQELGEVVHEIFLLSLPFVKGKSKEMGELQAKIRVNVNVSVYEADMLQKVFLQMNMFVLANFSLVCLSIL